MCRQGEIIDISKYYRIVSLTISSILYAICIPTYTSLLKIIVLLGMIASSFLLIMLYQNLLGEKGGFLLVVIEVVWNSFFLGLSGGFTSPYIWYCISSVVLAYVLGRAMGAGLTLTIYTVVGIWATNYQEKSARGQPYMTILIAVGFILLTIIILLLVQYGEQLVEQRKRMEFLLSINQSRQVMDELCKHMNRMLKATAAVWVVLDEHRKIQYSQRYNWPDELECELNNIIDKKEWDTVHKMESRVEKLQSFWCCVSFLPYNENRNGIYIYLGEDERSVNRKREKLHPWLVLIQNILRKEYTEEMYEELLRSEEQNRIASEIHDTVLQKLFAISCNSYTIERKCEREEEKQAIHSLKLALDETMGELREAVYGYSWNKMGEEPFVARVEKYMEEMQQLYGIQIGIAYDCDMKIAKKNQKTALYRIISESISNAIHHGNAHHIKVFLQQQQKELYASITDDGTGIQAGAMEKGKMGIGIANMTYLTEICGGKLTISSPDGFGTKVEAVMPILE